ncbi:stage III sporulation protein AA [Tissierella sp. Yu-01]|uniref:stage III sporulation protein AA n=1 Tax=Tissierella sp. Yu-01 TaxID=3035694 RepID=UPI00240E3725|nr:stage III sporulation protein AA [Tissierella sp. Yu-01]WFA09688.1 stage III sporulation protein AA [Tissierella sp. Yu-01]
MVDKIFDSVIENFTLDIKHSLSSLPDSFKDNIEEVRLRINAPLSIYVKGRDYFVTNEGKVTDNPKKGMTMDFDQLNKTFQIVCNYSIYALSEEIKNGFITIRGGHRVGIGGKIIYGNMDIETIKNISSLNFRIAREKKGISNGIIKYLMKDQEFLNTLIISPPQCGKTTLLRDIIRNLSNGMKDYNIRGHKIGLVDERSEIAGVYNGIPQKDVGMRTDILDSCKKSLGIMMLIRAMSPEIIAVDEIGSVNDVEAIEDATRAGIKLIATIHGYSIDDIKGRKALQNIFNEKIFKRYIILDNSKGVGTIKEIMDSNTLKNLLRKEGVI